MNAKQLIFILLTLNIFIYSSLSSDHLSDATKISNQYSSNKNVNTIENIYTWDNPVKDILFEYGFTVIRADLPKTNTSICLYLDKNNFYELYNTSFSKFNRMADANDYNNLEFRSGSNYIKIICDNSMRIIKNITSDRHPLGIDDYNFSSFSDTWINLDNENGVIKLEFVDPQSALLSFATSEWARTVKSTFDISGHGIFTGLKDDYKTEINNENISFHISLMHDAEYRDVIFLNCDTPTKSLQESFSGIFVRENDYEKICLCTDKLKKGYSELTDDIYIYYTGIDNNSNYTFEIRNSENYIFEKYIFDKSSLETLNIIVPKSQAYCK